MKKEKLTIKELAAYLPYKLKCKVIASEWYDEGFGILYSIDLDEETGVISGNTLHNKTIYCVEADFSDIKPILYPLSSLTKEIEHNGAKFVPLEIIVGIALKEMNIKESDAVVLSRMIMYNDNLHKLPFWVIQKLFEWKIDVFNLIPQGLAIDVTTLETNPYK